MLRKHATNRQNTTRMWLAPLGSLVLWNRWMAPFGVRMWLAPNDSGALGASHLLWIPKHSERWLAPIAPPIGPTIGRNVDGRKVDGTFCGE